MVFLKMATNDSSQDLINTNDAEDLIIVNNVRKTFGGLVALDEVNIRIPRQKLTMIIGPNGSGKTTLLNVISGFLKPDKGKIIYKNNDITPLPPHIINKLGLVRTFQIPQPFINLSVLENLLVAARWNPGESFLRAPIKKSWEKQERDLLDKAFDILKTIKLDHLWNSRASELSGGQMKLLEIGRALMNDAEAILMDEPAAGINPALAHEIFQLIKNLIKTKKLTFMIIEHRLDIALQYVDYVFAMARGRVVSQGLPDKVINDPIVIESYLSG